MTKNPPAVNPSRKMQHGGGNWDLASLIKRFTDSAEATNVGLTNVGLVRLQTALTGQKLRYFVYRSSGFGNQANTVNLIKRMIALGFTQSAELIYDATNGREVIDKLAVLLPGLDPANPQPYVLNGVTLTFFPYTEKNGSGKVNRSVTGLSGQVPLCINGGAELDSITEMNLAKVLLSDYYLQLQPYMWEIVNTSDNPLSLILAQNASVIVDLAKQDALQKKVFSTRAFGMPAPAAPNWDQLLSIPKVNKASINRARAVVDSAADAKILSFPVYGLYDAPMIRKPVNGDACDMAFELVAANALAQKSGAPFNKPIVVGLLNTLLTTTFQRLKDYFPRLDEDVSDEDTSDLDQDERITYNIRHWCVKNALRQTSTDGKKTGNIYIYETISQSDLTGLLDRLNAEGNGGVVVVNLPGLPQDLFNYLYQIAQLPSVFEGQGTANLALNLGKPFFKLAKVNVNPYPSTLGNPSADEASMAGSLSEILYNATYNLIQLGTYKFKSGFVGVMPPQQLANLLIEQAVDYKNNGPYRKYFDGLKTFYTSTANDKLLQALVFLVTKYNLGAPGHSHSLKALSVCATQDDETPLESLYAQIEGAVSQGVLSLIPTVIPDGPFADFITAMIEGTDFTLGSATSPVQVVFPASHDSISVTGQTDDFLGAPLQATVDFTMNEDGSSIDINFGLVLGDLHLDGVEWFGLESLNITARIPGNDDRLSGSVATKVTVGDNPLTFSMDFPTSGEGKIVIDGDLSTNPPSLNDLFSLLGGMNFISTLPSQISGAGNIALQNLKFGYDYETSSIETFELALQNSQPWTLFPKLTLSNLAFNIVLLEPTGSRTYSWQAKTSVMIGPQGGDPAEYGSIDVGVSYPNLTVTASMADDTPPIPLGDLVTFFLPANYTINLHANLGNLDMTVTPGEKGTEAVYSIAAGLALDQWDLALGVATFSLTDIFIKIEGTGVSEASGSLAATVVLFSEDPDIAVTLNLTAAYASNGAWSFAGVQGDSDIKVKQIVQTYLGSNWWTDGMPNLDISELVFNVDSPATGEPDENQAKSYMVGGTIRVWDTPLGNDFETIITAKFGSGTKEAAALALQNLSGTAEVPVLNERGEIVPMQACPLMLEANNNDESDEENTQYGSVSAQIIWNNIDLTIFYNYDQGYNAYGFSWGALSAKIDSKTNTATLNFTDSTTLGSMVETFVSWLTGSKFGLAAPWNILNDITLANLSLEWNFDTNTVRLTVDIGPIDLIFAKVTGISMTYIPSGKTVAGEKSGVHVSLDGTFIWLNSGEPLAWDAADPSSTPAPPGGGNKYLDLRLLAAGQHVNVAGLQNIKSVQDAIKLLAELPVPDGTAAPAIGFDAGNNWLFATDFGILKIEDEKKGGDGSGTQLISAKDAADAAAYVFTLQVVFTDPTLYALRIALEGEAAKVFAGLDFQIIYRKISDGLGVFQAEITLPTLMRRIDVGAYTLTLPTFGVEIYTSGDFKFDIGFPWNEDFSRSFSVEAIIPPGIPALGSGGFYFGKLPAVVVSQLPLATNGFFNPNLVFGFGAQLGLGKSLDLGILKAGFSLTIFGIIEGILAKWNPYDTSNTGGGDKLALQGDYYFWLQGTFGIIGHLYGSIDFVIIKASVDINLKLYAQITLASYSPIPITVSVSVSVSASATINLGLFKISVSFSFSTHIRESFTLGYLQDPRKAPWKVAGQNDGGRLLSLKSGHPGLHAFARTGLAAAPSWNNLLAGSAADKTLTAYLGFSLTVAGDNAFGSGAPDLSKQFPCYVASLFIEAPGAAKEGEAAQHNLLRAAGQAPDTSFEKLAKRVACWAVSSLQTSAMTPEQIDTQVVTDAALAGLIDYLSDAQNVPMPLSAEDVDAFMNNQFSLTVSLPTEAGTAEAAYFPMALDLNIAMPGYGGAPDLSYTFGNYNAVSTDFVTWLREYFNQLAVQVQQESGAASARTSLLYSNSAVSVGSFIFSDYFVLVMRQMLQAMRDGLKDFNYALAAGDTANSVVSWVNTTGNLVASGTPFSLYDLFKGNETHPLNAGKNLSLPFVAFTASGGDSFTSVSATGRFGGAFTAPQLATLNASLAGILKAGITVTYKTVPYVITGNETLDSLAARINQGIPLADLLAESDVLTLTTLLTSGAQLTVPPFSYTTQAGDTLQNLTVANGITVQDLAGVARDGEPNPAGTVNGDVADLFSAADSSQNPLYLDLVELPQFRVAELLAEAQRVNAINHLSGMASRYYFHGLRLPTANITPNEQGMWVTKNTQTGALSLPDYAGLFALTGQQLPLPTLPVDPLTITLSKAAPIDWLNFAGNAANLTFTVVPPAGDDKDGDLNYQRLSALSAYAAHTILPAGPVSVAAKATVEDEPARYPLSNGTAWQSLAAVIFPQGGSQADDQPRVWPLPSSMISLSGQGGVDQSNLLTLTSPNFELQSVRMNPATGKAEDTPVERLGWASSIEFTVKKLAPNAAAGAAYQDTYEISGASAADAIILERIVQYVHNDSEFASLAVGYQSVSSSAGAQLAADVGDSVTFGISQTNLSTVTQPPGVMSSRLLEEQDNSGTNLLNKPTELVRLLWEASITRAGGFFLYYFDASSGGGLPDAAFNDKGEATLTLLVIYQNQPRLQSWMNAVTTGDAMDTANSTLVAKAMSQKISHSVQTGNSLASVALLHYSNIVSIIDTTLEAGGDILLAAGAVLAVNNGVYRVPVDGSAPGGKLADIAQHFAMDPLAIKAANPRVPDADWTGSLPNGAAIRLPVVNRTIGTDPGGESLGSVAAFYGTRVVVLAGHNATNTQLLKAGQTLNLMSGPLSQYGAPMPGVQPILATRDGLPVVPDDPKSSSFAADFLLNDYTLLAYQVEESFDFTASNIGLPLGQQAADSSSGEGKRQFVRSLTAADSLLYKTSVPYLQFATDNVSTNHLSTHNADTTNPYSANGRLLQIGYSWNDLYGNKIVSTLDDTSTPAGADNHAPGLTGYTDKLFTTAQWPSVSVNWTVANTDPVSNQFVINVTSAFDPGAFNPSPQDLTGAWMSRATSSLQMINAILAQINDPNGIVFSVDTSLLHDRVQVDDVQIGTGGNYGKSGTLTGWLVAIQTFLKARARGDSTAPEPQMLSFGLSVTAAKQAVKTEDIFLLKLNLVITRTGGVAEGDFAAVAAVMEASTLIAAKTSVGTAGAASGGKQDILQGFAEDVEEALSQPGYTLTVATGADRYKPAAGAAASAVWALRLATGGSGQGIAYEINDAGKPELFAPEPVSNTLITRDALVYPYSKLTDYDPVTKSFTTTPRTEHCAGVEVDNWLSTFFSFFDTLFSPELTSSMLVIDAKATNKPAEVSSFLTALAEQKEALADVAAGLMAPVYAGQTSTRLDSAKETFRQTLLVKLSNLYTVRAAVSFGATVVEKIPQTAAELSPQLFGNLTWNTADTTLQSLITLTSPKMPLAKGDNQPVTFLLESPGNIKINGEVLQAIQLDLTYTGAAIEHQVAAMAGIEGYVASSWLSPVSSHASTMLAANLGQFTVPLILRSFPSTPRMTTQSGVATDKSATVLSQLTQWTYSYTYSLDFHFEQDRVYNDVLFNIQDSGFDALTGYLDAFQGLAQFVACQAELSALVSQTVSQIDAQTTDQKKIDDASLALGAFLKVSGDIATQASGAGGLRMHPQGGGQLLGEVYKFSIAEASQTITLDKTDLPVWVVTLTSAEGAPAGLTGSPQVMIAGYDAVALATGSDPASGVYAYYYVDQQGNPLQGAVAQSIAARTVALPGMQILSRQDALSTVHLTRNENINGEINSSFVFVTPEVSFGNPMHPTLRSRQKVNIATLGSGDGQPVKRSLDAHLTALFTALFEEGFTGDSTLQVNMNYHYQLADALNAMSVPIPIAVMPPLNVSVDGSNVALPSLTATVTMLSEAIATWAQTYLPSSRQARLIFDVTIMSNLTRNPMPLLDLANLELPVVYIDPPLKGRGNNL